MLGFLMGIHGDKEQGIRTVQEVAAHGKLNRVDAEIFLGALYRRENQPRKAIPLVQDLIRAVSRGIICCGWSCRRCTAWRATAQHAMEAVEESRPAQDPPRSRLRPRPLGEDLLPGGHHRILVPRSRTAPWRTCKKVAAAADDVDLNTGVYAYLRMGQIYDMTHRRPQAVEAYRKAIAYAPQAEAAQESKKYLSRPYRRM